MKNILHEIEHFLRDHRKVVIGAMVILVIAIII